MGNWQCYRLKLKLSQTLNKMNNLYFAHELKEESIPLSNLIKKKTAAVLGFLFFLFAFKPLSVLGVLIAAPVLSLFSGNPHEEVKP